MSALLEVKSLHVDLPLPAGLLHAVRDVSFSLAKGETLSLVGESGCGKSMTALAIMNLLPRGAIRRAETLLFEGLNLAAAADADMIGVRGARMAMIFQEPMTSLDPCYTIGNQLEEALLEHRKVSKKEARDRAVLLLDKVGITGAAARLKQYPHQLSGGLRQRVMIAMAIACGPALLIADEPTTALDVTIQAQILDLLVRLQQDLEMSILMITHDLGVVAEFCDHVVVMYAGMIAEKAPVDQIFNRPRHPYTHGLLASVPQLGKKQTHLPTIPGMVPAIGERPQGCYYAQRCERVTDLCRRKIPPLDGAGTEIRLACWNPYEN